jgi:hypothetical protein
MELATFFTRSTRNVLRLDVVTRDRQIRRYKINEGNVLKVQGNKFEDECIV